MDTRTDKTLYARLEISERQRLLNAARLPLDLRSLAFAGVIGQSLQRGQEPLIRGLSEREFKALLASYFPGVSLENGTPYAGGDLDEFSDLVALLLEHASGKDASYRWLACAIATAAMSDEHLWQDMGLPSRKELSAILATFFTELAAKNSGDMKWKKFFYRQLCERAGVMICRSPHCQECGDYSHCFGEE